MNLTSYQQATRNLEYLSLKQMVAHLNEVVDFSIHNQLSFMDTLVKLTNYEIDVREQKHDSCDGEGRCLPSSEGTLGF